MSKTVSTLGQLSYQELPPFSILIVADNSWTVQPASRASLPPLTELTQEPGTSRISPLSQGKPLGKPVSLRNSPLSDGHRTWYNITVTLRSEKFPRQSLKPESLFQQAKRLQTNQADLLSRDI